MSWSGDYSKRWRPSFPLPFPSPTRTTNARRHSQPFRNSVTAGDLFGGRASPTSVAVNSLVTDRPEGLAHLQCQLFRKIPTQTESGVGVALVEAPGEVGEARLIARCIRSLIAEGARPDDIVVTTRDLDFSRDLLDEVFTEYGLPIEIDGGVPLIRNPAVATLIRSSTWPPKGSPLPA